MYFWEDFHWVSADIGLFINLFTLFAITYNITVIYYNCERKQEKFNGEETSSQPVRLVSLYLVPQEEDD